MYFSFSYFLSSVNFPGGSDGKASAYNAGDPGSTPGSGISPGEVNGTPLQYSCLGNPMESTGSQIVAHDWGTSFFFFSCETFPYSNHRLYITQREKKHIFNFQKLLLQSKLEHLTLNNKLEGWKTKGWHREAPFLFLFHPRLIRKGQEKSTLWLESESESHSVVSNSLRPHGLYSPWNSPGKNTGVGTLSLLQGIFPTQGLNLVSHIVGGFFTS